MNTTHSSWEKKYLRKQKVKQYLDYAEGHIIKHSNLIIVVKYFYGNLTWEEMNLKAIK